MKKLFILPLCLLAIVACTDGKKVAEERAQHERDSLMQVIDEKETELNDIMGSINEIQEGFRQINEAEGRITVANGNPEAASSRGVIRENMEFIQQTMQQNRELIKKLQGQLRDSDFKSAELRRVITNMLTQLDVKDQQLQQLRAELEAKDIHIAELDKTISNLNVNVNDLMSESEEKTQTINSQDAQINTAWYVFGTKHELKDQHILVDGKVLQSNFNRNYFTKIDIRVTDEIKLYSRSAKILTTHPTGSYELFKDNNKLYVLRISNPQIFWSTSKYLVILVK